ncbi:transforming growth factor beta receptor type 3 [Plectropomus leopardus]|uniref:transforming growth factor beta receptor type 3 n=1 Tax=Plectropomus leopardus TaxID=160734 RepID=UPI001C4AD6A4|nr:transforming growth factor beta receptor type 3 [Plectropomus leopardus]XP_042360093.1 transforming growth factor beta receptor type 3 [Plectropomus leopardus]
MFTMPSLSGVRWIVFGLLLWKRTTAHSVELRCSVAPVGALHPVQGLLERFEAGPGCAARERGVKETHVIAVGRVTHSPENKVTVLLRPLSPSSSPLRALHLLLSSKLPVTWWLQAERLPPDLPVLVQVSSNSSVQSHNLRLNVQTVHSLPFRPHALHRWALKHHGNLSSLTHTTHGNRVYVLLGEDPSLPAVCQLQSMFLSHNYMTSDLQPQEVQGCADAPAGGISPEVHVIKLHSAGSGLCGSLQVEVIVSLVPLKANSKTQVVVLILSSSVPVNWAIVARGVRGHVSIHSSNSVSPPYPPEPGLTLSSTLNPDLSTIPDLLLWASESGYTTVTSYTEADLANRFVIQLAGGGTDAVAVMNPLVVRPPWAEERRLRQWLSGGGRAGGRQESFTVQCEDGRLSVTVDRHILQSLSVPLAAVTLRDSTCQAQSNGSHFLLVFPVISCGTEGLLLGQPRGLQYKNMVLLWRDEPRTILALNETEIKSKNPLGIHFSCLAAAPTVPRAADDDDVNTQTGPVHWVPEGPDPGLSHLPTPRHRPGPVLTLKLFVTESYEERRIGPCVITADHRVYVEISAKGSFIDVAEVTSCVVSPLSDPKKSRFWTVISDGCSSDPSLTLSANTKDEDEEEEEAGGDGELEEEKEDTDGPEKERGEYVPLRHKVGRGGREAAERMEKEIRPLRFHFILRPVYNDSMQFLHCSLRLCVSDTERAKPTNGKVKTDCEDGLRIPPLVSKSARHQCEIRNLSRPMVVTQPISSLASKLPRPPAGQRTKRLSVPPVAGPDPESSSSVVQMGPVMGIVFAAFVMGVSLMGGLWCIYYHTGVRAASLRGESRLTDQTHEGGVIWNPPLLSDQSSSSV